MRTTSTPRSPRLLAGAALAALPLLAACQPQPTAGGVVPQAAGGAVGAVIEAPPIDPMELVIRQNFGPVADQAIAVARCESNMDPNARSATDDHGLFQINAVHAEQFSAVTGLPWSAVYDPGFNAAYAKWLYDREGWTPWSCRRVL